MTELKAYQALASQIESVIDLLLQDHADRLKWRNEVLRQLAELKPQPNGHADTFLTTTQAKTLWAMIKPIAPWIAGGGISTALHLLAHYLHR